MQQCVDECVAVRHTGTHRGCGVFALTALPRGAALGRYVGETLTRAQLDARYAAHGRTPTYVLQLGRDSFIDARDPTKSNWTRFLNDPRGTGKRANVRVGARGSVKTCRAVKAGEELLFSYGRQYHLPKPLLQQQQQQQRAATATSR